MSHEQNVIETMIQSYIESYKQSAQDIKESQLAIIKKAQQTSKAYIEKNEQCIHLTDELKCSQEEVKELTLTLEEMQKKEETMRQKWQDLFSKFAGIEKKYDTEIHNAKITIEKLNSQLNERTKSDAEHEIELAELRSIQQTLSDQLDSNNEAYNNQIQSLETINSSLQDENNKLTANLKILREEIAEQIACYKELTLSMQKSSMATNVQKVNFENAVKHHELELKKAQDIRATLEGNLVHKEQDCQKLLQQNQQLSEEIQGMRQKFELELNEKKEEMEKLYCHNQNVTKTYMCEEELYKEKIVSLQGEIKKLREVNINHEDEITSLIIGIEKVSQTNEDSIEQEKAKIQKAFEEKEKLMQEKLVDLEKELNRKDNELLDLERKKNSTIAELKYKMNKIGTVFSQSVGSATVFHETNESDSKTYKNQMQPVSDTVGIVTLPLNKSENTIKSKKSRPSAKKMNRLDAASPSESLSWDIFDKLKSAP
ncbi:uncharacterized protein Dwil_GK10347 [Drosophila willistoni]|uniref:Uncharacterized protein n=1 Tax=Drosophila willistoni TaxID=7260 RepID=B4MJ83_DROWI|nr:uncharacterized protein Dwil_GK10347 [Drosophila willistoni]